MGFNGPLFTFVLGWQAFLPYPACLHGPKMSCAENYEITHLALRIKRSSSPQPRCYWNSSNVRCAVQEETSKTRAEVHNSGSRKARLILYKVSGDGCGIQSCGILLWGTASMLMHNCGDSVTRPEELLAVRRQVKCRRICVWWAFPTWHGRMCDTGRWLRREWIWHYRVFGTRGNSSRDDSIREDVGHGRKFTRELEWHARIFVTRGS